MLSWSQDFNDGLTSVDNLFMSDNVRPYVNIVKEKSHMIISLDTGKPANKIQYSFITETFSELGISGNIYSLVKITKNLQQTSCVLEKC